MYLWPIKISLTPEILQLEISILLKSSYLLKRKDPEKDDYRLQITNYR